jgi:hypothetical protein
MIAKKGKMFSIEGSAVTEETYTIDELIKIRTKN